ncbi:helix-turn-helix domain-containing protein (plasmid) [Enterococcus gilvus]|uniref:helix-turn-helix domain-containing protein n=1 Tax=Enterococcus gilvus TaxID=160453 RepID=UPI000DF5D8FB|nr:helix-turn-helix transcriptional regulator [Enterococcus gilvus]AXG40631.1 helix-turn-helix domain-containing protein [Enterococcus gilvus]
MDIGEQIKEHRKHGGWTQKELAERLNVSDKTISSWETGRTYPELTLLVELSELFNVSLDSLLGGDVKVVKKIDKDVRLKKVYRTILIGMILVLFGGIIFLTQYQNQNQWVDRLNPFMKMNIGYATLPTSVTYNGGKKYREDGKAPQFPDPYKNIWVADDPFGEGMLLDFQGGQAPEGKNYALVQHKGTYVKRISFISWKSIPGVYRDIMSEEYYEVPSMKE